MSQTSNLYNGYTEENKGPSTTIEPNSPNKSDNVEGWLLNVHTYRDPTGLEPVRSIVDADNNSIPTQMRVKNGRAGSITSEDSVNLDDLINANFTTDMDDETDLPDLADLDLDDSTDDFWKLDGVSVVT
ncbi:hypothetical protein EDC96DRAFT_221779 [Choanephora cucurbitarum]|nr:hypothetical protein EDC96DRAFT_221779 [Choanephora cucurbitarum]